MLTTRIQRYPVRPRSSFPALGCGCLSVIVGGLAVAGVSLVLLLPNLPDMAAQLIGFTPRGNTNEVFQAATPVPTIELQNIVQPQQFTVDLGQYGEQTLPNDTGLYTLQVGNDQTGTQAAVVSFSEAGLQELCRQRTELCGPNNPRYRNARIDLRPGGAVIYADVSIPELGGIEQMAGVVLRLDASGQRFEFAGVDLGGTLYDVPPDSLGTSVSELEHTGNDILSQLILEVSGDQFVLSQVSVDDTTLTVTMR
jgi:hypothetical protein